MNVGVCAPVWFLKAPGRSLAKEAGVKLNKVARKCYADTVSFKLLTFFKKHLLSNIASKLFTYMSMRI